MAVENRSVAAERDFVITRILDAPRALAFQAWTDPKHMAQWWGPKAFTTPVCEMDVLPRGAYRIVMRSPEGVDYPITGIFVEVVPSERLVMTMDVRPGGAYRIVMRSPEGGDYPMTGVFMEVAPPERLVLTMDCSEHPDEWHDMVNPNWDRKTRNSTGELITTVVFEEHDGKTKLTIMTRFESSAIRDAMVKMGISEGWSESLDRLEALLARL